MLSPASFFNLSELDCAGLFSDCNTVWEPLAKLKDYCKTKKKGALDPQAFTEGNPLAQHLIVHEGQLFSGTQYRINFGNVAKGELLVQGKTGVLPGASVLMAGSVLMGSDIHIGQGVLIEPGALIKGPCFIGDYTEIRQGAYLRGYCLIGRRCVVGHTTEVKHSIFLDDAKAGHFAYLGDSILGRNVNLGAGTKCANLRFLPGNVLISTEKDRIDSGLRKLGAILGDEVQTGCNSVTSPGTLLGPGSLLMPNATAASGVHPARSLLR